MAIKINNAALLPKLIKEKELAFKYQERRHPQWRDNYLLYRLDVQENRLNQREDACVPLTKGTVKSIVIYTRRQLFLHLPLWLFLLIWQLSGS